MYPRYQEKNFIALVTYKYVIFVVYCVRLTYLIIITYVYRMYIDLYIACSEKGLCTWRFKLLHTINSDVTVVYESFTANISLVTCTHNFADQLIDSETMMRQHVIHTK